MRTINVIVYDLGSTYTKAAGFFLEGDTLAFIGQGQAPTTLQDVQVGADQARERLLAKVGGRMAEDIRQYASCSAAGGLRMVAMGYMPRVTAKAAKEVAMTAGARVMEVISYEEPAKYRLEVLREIRPDIILLAGGTDCGDESSVLENVELICQSKTKATVIIACNRVAQGQAARRLGEAGITCRRVANIMPTIHELRTGPAREAIHEQFIHQITQAEGVGAFAAALTDPVIVPTPGAVLLATELLAFGTHREKGVDSVITIDIGGATTDIHSVLPSLVDLKLEERGLVVNNEKQASFRTVEGNLGMRVSALGIADAVGTDFLAIDQKGDRIFSRKQILGKLEYMESHTAYVSKDEADRWLDKRMALAATSVALRRHAGCYAAQNDPVMGVMAGTAIGRDLRYVKNIVCTGGIFAHSDKKDCKEIVEDSVKDPGISLLPLEEMGIWQDDQYIFYALGVLGKYEPDAVQRFMKQYFAVEEG